MKIFNLNSYVHVRIKEKGYEYLKEKGKNTDSYREREDKNGYVQFLAWEFFATFNSIPYMSNSNYYDINILIEESELKTLEESEFEGYDYDK